MTEKFWIVWKTKHGKKEYIRGPLTINYVASVNRYRRDWRIGYWPSKRYLAYSFRVYEGENPLLRRGRFYPERGKCVEISKPYRNGWGVDADTVSAIGNIYRVGQQVGYARFGDDIEWNTV